MNPERDALINGILVEEFYWNGGMVVYVNNRRSDKTFEEAIKEAEARNARTD